MPFPPLTARHKARLERMIRRAKSLHGRERTPVEQKFLDEHPDKWDYFMVFGIQPETQAYIDATIRQLESCTDIGQFVTADVRLDFSCEMLVGKKRGKP